MIGSLAVGFQAPRFAANPDEDPERLHPVTPQPHHILLATDTAPQWDGWPYDAASDDDDYGRNVPAWQTDGVDDMLTVTLSEDNEEGDGSGSDGGSEGGGGGAGGEEGDGDEDEDDENQVRAHLVCLALTAACAAAGSFAQVYQHGDCRTPRLLASAAVRWHWAGGGTADLRLRMTCMCCAERLQIAALAQCSRASTPAYATLHHVC